ncbi:MAG: hypothetical protein KF916_05500 [Microbacteriaceae bacterium]|nr:hypothetical protein [Microbacteriaceae bacterium]
MVKIFKQRDSAAPAPKLKTRDQAKAQIEGIDHNLTLEFGQTLVWIRAIQLGTATGIAANLVSADALEAKTTIAAVLRKRLKAHKAVSKIVLPKRLTYSEDEFSSAHAKVNEIFQLANSKSNREGQLGTFIVGGLLDDLAAVLVENTVSSSEVIVDALPASLGIDKYHRVIATAIEEDPKVANVLALWGRRLLGDALLVVRAALKGATTGIDFEAEIAPLIAELISSHTRRMYALGLTA